MNHKPTFAIVDWGIGGISIYREATRQLRGLSVLYFSDTGATPYGKMSRDELITRLNSVVSFLGSQGVGDVLFGCNAASTAIPFLRKNGLRVEGIIHCATDVASRARPRRLALIGGRRTVLSGVYRRALSERGIDLVQRIAQPLSALIESGDTSSAVVREQCERILAPVKNCSHLLLACTHYPAIIPTLQEFLSRDTIILDPTTEIVSRIRRMSLEQRSHNAAGNGGADVFLTTGSAKNMIRSAKKAFDVEISAGEVEI
ncbi:MAG TPA: aspartate/glutamate racemase family protein [Blastocatellia bacterium]|nr:aspartate/glutamate racemase family protein [Blastocatellia bacterium]